MLRVNELIATKVHGYIPIELVFKPQLTFLTGTNGCGKTTALKLISAILKPDLRLLSDIDFSRVTLKCSVDNSPVTIELQKIKAEDVDYNDEFFSLTISTSELQEHPMLFYSIQWENTNMDGKKGSLRLYHNNRFAPSKGEERASILEALFLEFTNSDFYKAINSFDSPILLGIDRKISGKITTRPKYGTAGKYGGTRGTKTLRSGSPEMSFLDAQRVIVNYVSEKAERKRQLVEDFKANIFSSLFRYVHYDEESDLFDSLSMEELLLKKKITINAIQRLEMGEDIVNEVTDYFDNLETLLPKVFPEIYSGSKGKRKSNTHDVNEYLVNRPHLQRIESIAKFAEEFQQEIDELDHPLNEITRLANYFFEESKKRIRISANGSVLVERTTGEGQRTGNLSSGEIQIIVIIIHLVFCEHQENPTVFVVDEPELSLHISWQEKFVEAMTEASKSTQFILATHSPAIISKLEYEKNCIYLKNI